MRKPTQREREAEARGLERAGRRAKEELRLDAGNHATPGQESFSDFWEGAMSSDGIIADWCLREARKLRRGK